MSPQKFNNFKIGHCWVCSLLTIGDGKGARTPQFSLLSFHSNVVYLHTNSYVLIIIAPLSCGELPAPLVDNELHGNILTAKKEGMVEMTLHLKRTLLW